MVDETVDRRERHGLVRENLRPVGKGLVGSDQQGAAFVAGRDELEQNAGLRLVLADVGEVIEVRGDTCRAWRWLPRAGGRGGRYWSRWTRSVVRVNSTRQPLSTSARPSAAPDAICRRPAGRT